MVMPNIPWIFYYGIIINILCFTMLIWNCTVSWYSHGNAMLLCPNTMVTMALPWWAQGRIQNRFFLGGQNFLNGVSEKCT